MSILQQLPHRVVRPLKRASVTSEVDIDKMCPEKWYVPDNQSVGHRSCSRGDCSNSNSNNSNKYSSTSSNVRSSKIIKRIRLHSFKYFMPSRWVLLLYHLCELISITDKTIMLFRGEITTFVWKQPWSWMFRPSYQDESVPISWKAKHTWIPAKLNRVCNV